MCLEGGAELVDVVADHRRCDNLRACVANGSGQHDGVGLVDLSRLQRLAGRDELRTGGHHQNPLARNDSQLTETESSGKTERGRRDDLPGPQHGCASGDVLACVADVLAHLGGGTDRHSVRRAVGGLDGDNGGGA